MRVFPFSRRPHAALLAAVTLWSGLYPGVAQAQPTPAMEDDTRPDPPARVGRLARTAGTVSYHAAGDPQWVPATRNIPLAAGSALWVEPNGEAEVQLSASRLTLAGGSELAITALDSKGLRATLTRGKAVPRPRDLMPGEAWELRTPRGLVSTLRPGRLVVTAGDRDTPTVVSVLEGEARITGPGLDRTLTSGQAASISGTDVLDVSLGPAAPDPFADAEQARDRPPIPPPAVNQSVPPPTVNQSVPPPAVNQSVPPPAVNQSVPPPPLVNTLPGGEELAGYGSWSRSPNYGEVWFPAMDPGWAPYRQGHWAFIRPWGWTWIDDAPWGFAPFHYGRWAEIEGRWAWVPGLTNEPRFSYPVYAPALVAFVGLGSGLAIANRPRHWTPLAPREAFRPWYPASPRHATAVNNAAAFVGHRAIAAPPPSVIGPLSRPAPPRAFTGSAPPPAVVRPAPPVARAAPRFASPPPAPPLAPFVQRPAPRFTPPAPQMPTAQPRFQPTPAQHFQAAPVRPPPAPAPPQPHQKRPWER